MMVLRVVDDWPGPTPETRDELVAAYEKVFGLEPVEAEVLADQGFYGYLRWKHGVAGLA